MATFYVLGFAPLAVAAPLSIAAPVAVRAFAVGNKVEVRYADTYQNFHDKIFALVDARHPRRSELVQSSVDDVASHLSGSDPTAPAAALVNFPEDVGLVAGLIGSRGAAARRATVANGGSVAAFGSLIQHYDAQIQYYTQRWPGLPAVRYLLLAETDTFYRACYETFRELARSYGVYVSATLNVASARRLSMEEDAALVGLLRDPDETAIRDYAYVATSPEVYNSTFLFDADGNILVASNAGHPERSPVDTGGELRASWHKAYLTEPEQDTLPLAYGAVRDLEVLDTPIGRMASVISKDAWMIDVNDRLDAKAAEIVLQPEAFSEWAYVASPWQPDGFKAGGFAQVQRNPSYRYNVTPSLTGNLFEVTFDGQSAVIGKRFKSDAATSTGAAFIGQNDDIGILRVGPWIRDDPGDELTLLQRRDILAADGAHLLPGARPRCASPTTFGACENGYRESVVFADLNLNGRGSSEGGSAMPTAWGMSSRVDNGEGRALHPRLVAHGGRVYVVWQESAYGVDSIVLGISDDGGIHFRQRRVSDNASGTVTEMRPALALDANIGNLFVAWQEFCHLGDDDCGRIKLARFNGDGEKLGSDTRVDDTGDRDGKWNPALAVTRGGNPLVAWVDERDRGSLGQPLEHIYFARGRHRGVTFLPNVRVDHGAPVAVASALDNKWQPSVAVWGRRIYVTWTDFRNYNWDIFAARSFNGRRFSENVRVDDSPEFERIDDHPSAAVDSNGALHIVWADRRTVNPDTNIMHARSTDGGRQFSANLRIDSADTAIDPNRAPGSNQWHPRIAASGNDVVVTWQDNRLGDNDIFVARSRDGGVRFEMDERVDDSGTVPSNQCRPDVAIDDEDPNGRIAYVVWEDDRWGSSHIALGRRSLQ